jgi:hypothetical protein
MAAGKTTTTTDETKEVVREARRLQSLQPKDGKLLSSLEEAVVRMHHGVSVRAEAELATNAVTDELARTLLDMEVDAHVKSGRADDLPDIPPGEAEAAGNDKTRKLAQSLAGKLGG